METTSLHSRSTSRKSISCACVLYFVACCFISLSTLSLLSDLIRVISTQRSDISTLERINALVLLLWLVSRELLVGESGVVAWGWKLRLTRRRRRGERLFRNNSSGWFHSSRIYAFHELSTRCCYIIHTAAAHGCIEFEKLSHTLPAICFIDEIESRLSWWVSPLYLFPLDLALTGGDLDIVFYFGRLFLPREYCEDDYTHNAQP